MMDKKARKYARRYAMQVLYSYDVNPEAEGVDPNEVETEETKRIEGENLAFAESIIARVKEHEAEIDDILTKHLRRWSLSQMNVVDKTILRMGAAELLYQTAETVDAKVIINEAVDMAKVFSGENSYRLINGILNTIAQERDGKAE
jgi:transcription antitermination protein NusB